MGFLGKIIQHLGFVDVHVILIISCLSLVSYSILLNGQLVGNIKPNRGLKQGDQLSSYLFLLCAMGLQGLLKKIEVDDDIKGVSICRNRPWVSHLFFCR